MDSSDCLKKEKISILNKLFRKCNSDIFTKYINAHYGLKYLVEFIVENKKYLIPEKILFYNYFNDYYLMEQIQSEQKNNKKDDEDEDDDLDLNDDEELDEEEDYY